MQLEFSFIIPVYNRPDEIKELLDSFVDLEGNKNFEIVIVEDGSTSSSKAIVEQYSSKLDLSYYFKENSGPGDSRNFGMQRANGNYFIILDSDCLLPKDYLNRIKKSLNDDYVDCFGGPDAAHSSFSNIQKAINFSMTSFITTGGIRGRKNRVDEFQPRSFNMGISKAAFQASNGFGSIHPGEDPDLSIRLKKLGFKIKLIPEAYVFHKRRISWSKFYKQVYKFGLVRSILNTWHPETKNITYWFPTLFTIFFIVSLILYFLNVKSVLMIYGLYFMLAFLISLISTKSFTVAILSILAICIQFFGYGYGFLKSAILIGILKNSPEEQFPDLFYNKS